MIRMIRTHLIALRVACRDLEAAVHGLARALEENTAAREELTVTMKDLYRAASAAAGQAELLAGRYRDEAAGQ